METFVSALRGLLASYQKMFSEAYGPIPARREIFPVSGQNPEGTGRSALAHAADTSCAPKFPLDAPYDVALHSSDVTTIFCSDCLADTLTASHFIFATFKMYDEFLDDVLPVLNRTDTLNRSAVMNVLVVQWIFSRKAKKNVPDFLVKLAKQFAVEAEALSNAVLQTLPDPRVVHVSPELSKDRTRIFINLPKWYAQALPKSFPHAALYSSVFPFIGKVYNGFAEASLPNELMNLLGRNNEVIFPYPHALPESVLDTALVLMKDGMTFPEAVTTALALQH